MYNVGPRGPTAECRAPLRARPWSAARETALRAQARAAGVEDGILWLGCLPPADMPALYNRAAVVVHPVADEPWGRAVAEAMACARPVVAVARGGVAELLADGAGTPTPPDDPEALAKAVGEVLDHPERAMRDGRKARSAIIARWSAPASARALAAFWREEGSV